MPLTTCSRLLPFAIRTESKSLVLHACNNIGSFRGHSLFLYDGHANGIRNRSHLDRVLDSSESLWIVPADVHY